MESPTEEHRALIEDFGLIFAHFGLPRMAGRIFGWLLICEPRIQSSADLAAILKASKGSISTMTRLLQQLGMIEKVGIAGQRANFFHFNPKFATSLIHGRIEGLSKMRVLLDRALDVIKEADPSHRNEIQFVRDFYEFFERETPVLVARWENEQKEFQS